MSVASTLAVCAALACGSKEKEGTLGGDCFPNWTCNAGLVCDRGMCVPADGGNETSSGDGDISEELQQALEECFECGADVCSAEADACDAEAGCKDVLSCSLGCAGDPSCASGCDASGLTQSGVSAMTNYSTCTAMKCVDTCVDALADIVAGGGDGDAGDGDGDAPATLEEAIADCFACGEGKCSAESDACSGASGCEEALECSISCAGDASCAAACDLSGLTQEGVTALGAYLTCTGMSCSRECSDAIIDAVNGGDGDTTSPGDGDGDDTTSGDGDTGEACSTPGEERYSCVDSAPQVCVDGTWIEESCDGCALVSPSDTCAKISGIAFRKISEEDVESFNPPGAELIQTASSVTGSWTFQYTGYPQYGVIQYKFSAAFDPDAVSISAEGEGIVSFETEDGSSGCEYILSGSTPVQNVQDYWDGCWGTTSGSRTVINVRTSQTIEGSASVTVTGISLL